ncbi:thermonuclease family protein [Chenggangzhangella methanolivorans]|nr:thermonuclease family protein [Chenggangzhangella methanolivorans]
MGCWAFAAMCLATLCCPAAGAAAEVIGSARVVDGDTIVVSGGKIRLNGVDAPETDQLCLTAAGQPWTCGVEARDRLSAVTAGKTWNCRTTAKDKYDRWLGDCLVDGVDLNGWMVEQGWALSFVRYSHRYDAHERRAREAQRGIWSGAFIAPWEWRSRSGATVVLGSYSVPLDAQKTLLAPATSQMASKQGCQIKGNLNRDGVCIYHVPGGRFYARTRIDESKGERWYCTPEEAHAAGCRRSLQ